MWKRKITFHMGVLVMNWNSHSVYKLNVPHYKKTITGFGYLIFLSYHLYGLMNKLSLFVYQHTYRHFPLCSNRTLSSRNQSGWRFFIHKKLIKYIWTEKFLWATTKWSLWTSTRMTRRERCWPQKGISLERKGCLWKKGFFHQRPQCHPKKIWWRTKELSS